MLVPTLLTPRLLLRPLAITDAAAIVRLAGAREVAAYTLRIPHPYTDNHAERFITAAARHAESGQSVVFAIEVQETSHFIGAIGLEIQPTHRHAELGYWIGVPYWGNGYATEAAAAAVRFGFETLQLHRIYAMHFLENAASGRVLRNIGMRHEGRLRQHVLKWDKFHDSEFYGMLRDEFVATGPEQK
jgi:ribosomal-protein-alanine N-acetyltransferase